MNSRDASIRPPLVAAAAVQRDRSSAIRDITSAARRIACGAAFFLACSMAAPATAAEPPELRVDADRHADAVLRDIFFIDPDRGWAVGDLGTIWHTTDGGQIWRSQPSGTTCNLQSVHFSTPERGLAAGGWYEADTGIGRGVLLRTDDGGRTWHSLETNLSALRSIRRLAGGTLVAIGGWSPLHRGSVFTSDDEGTNWHSIDGSTVRRVTAAALSDDGGVLVDDQGVVYSTGDLASDPVAIATLSGVRALTITGSHLAAVQSDRSIAISRDGGRTWTELAAPIAANRTEVTAASLEQPAELRRAHTTTNPPVAVLPLCAASADDGSIWIAGTPGTHVLRIDPQGILSQHATPVQGPIHALHFQDRHRGWAVTGFGCIIATRDGGRSWRLQHGTAERAMLLGVAVDAAELPWPVLASEALELGHRFAVAVGSQPPEPTMVSGEGASAGGAFDPTAHDPVAPAVEAAVRLGGGEVLQWDPASDAPEPIEAIIAGCAPSVLVLGADLSAAQRDRWLALAARAGVLRVFEVTGEERSELTVHSSAVLPVAGAITADLWADALAILAPERAVPRRLFLRRRWDQSRADRLASGISDGLPTSGARRRIPDGRRRNYQILQARSGEAGLIQRLIADARSLDDESLKRNLALLLKQSPMDNRPRLLRKLIHRMPSPDEDSGGIRLHLAALAAAAEQSGDSGLARRSQLRLQSILASAEWERLRSASLAVVQLPQHQVADEVAAHRSPFERDDPAVVQATATTTPLPTGAAAAGDPRSDEREALLSPDDLLWQMHPAVLLWKASGGRDAMSSWDRGALDRLGDAVSAGQWRRLARASSQPGIAALPIRLESAVPRPLLDGRLDDPCWSDFGVADAGATAAALSIRVAYDADYLYVALRGSFGHQEAPQPAARRQRDEDLSDEVRAVLEIDVDRDLLTAYELSVDARGRTRDTCDGFTQWQPMWYVATGREAGLQTVEAAIRRADLVDLPPVAGDIWRIRARIVKPRERISRATIADPAGWQVLHFN